jgi:hypothetical protein
MKRITQLVAAIAIGLVGLSAWRGAAQDTEEQPRFTGTWKWTFIMPDGSKVEPRVKLHLEGEKLTGTARFRPGADTPISDGKVNGDEVSFSVIRERDGRKVTTTYKGVLVGNHIKGSIESDWAGGKQAYDWDARRFGRDPGGTWEWTVPMRGRTNEIRLSLTLKQDKDTLTGDLTGFREPAEIEDGKTKDGEVYFKVLREVGDTTLTYKYWGRVLGDVIKGKVAITGGERDHFSDWEAKRTD